MISLRFTLICGLAAVVVVGCTLAADISPSVADGADRKRLRGPLCGTGRTLVRSPDARVFRTGDRVGGCIRGQRRSWLIAEVGEEDCFFLGFCTVDHPAIAGRWFAYTTEGGDGREAERYSEARVHIVDLGATRASNAERSVIAGIDLPGERTSDGTSWTGRGPVVALRVTRGGSVAFVVDDALTPAAGFRIYSARIAAAPAHYRWYPVELGAGADIRPRSLTLRRSVVTWEQGGVRRSSRLR